MCVVPTTTLACDQPSPQMAGASSSSAVFALCWFTSVIVAGASIGDCGSERCVCVCVRSKLYWLPFIVCSCGFSLLFAVLVPRTIFRGVAMRPCAGVSMHDQLRHCVRPYILFARVVTRPFRVCFQTKSWALPIGTRTERPPSLTIPIKLKAL